jgi:beta-glucanase (GH16 family)
MKEMRTLSLVLSGLLFLALASCSFYPVDPTISGPGEKASTSYDTTGYRMVWSDEFNGSAVDTSKWAYDTGGGGWGNSELEYYQPANAAVSGGYLNITAKKESAGGYAYTSCRMKTQGKYSFQYGKIVGRIKLPVGGKGYWPAFWILGTSGGSWPGIGEIDIMENINGANTVYCTCHYNDNGHKSYGTSTGCAISNFHDYEVEWNSSMIYGRVDGTQYYAFNITPAVLNEFKSWPFYIILNFAVGGVWPGNPNSSSLFPAVMQVDYVRVYQKSSSSGSSTSSSSTSSGSISSSSSDILTGSSSSASSSGVTTVQAENYASMSGVQTEACSDTGGGKDVGWIETGDWMIYNVNIPSSRNYIVKYRVASQNTGGILQLEKAGGSPVYGTVSILNTGGWQNWTTVSHTVSLTAGQQQIGIKAKTGGWNINWFSFE